MTRINKDTHFTHDVCTRLILMTEQILGLNRSELAKILKYKNASTLWHVWHKTVIPDIEKLKTLSEIRLENGEFPNLDWIVSGRGKPTITVDKKGQKLQCQHAQIDMKIVTALSRMPTAKKEHLFAIIKDQ